jgi:hypothetical protein
MAKEANKRLTRQAQVGELVARVFGGSVPKEPGHLADYTHVVKCFNCGAEFTTRDWIWGKHKFTQRVCDSCIANRDRRAATRIKPQEKREVRSPLPKEDY